MEVIALMIIEVIVVVVDVIITKTGADKTAAPAQEMLMKRDVGGMENQIVTSQNVIGDLKTPETVVPVVVEEEEPVPGEEMMIHGERTVQKDLKIVENMMTVKEGKTQGRKKVVHLVIEETAEEETIRDQVTERGTMIKETVKRKETLR